MITVSADIVNGFIGSGTTNDVLVVFLYKARMVKPGICKMMRRAI